MKVIIDGKEAKIPSGGSSSGVTMGQVNSAIDTKLDAYEPQEVYSTEEVRIGTWIDGKPLYRRVFNTTSPSVIETAAVVLGLDASLKIIDISGFLEGVYNNDRYMLNTYLDGTRYIRASYSNYNNQHGIWMVVGNDALKNRPVTLILEYTKTTDQAQTAATNTVLKASLKAPAVNSIPSAAVTASAQEVLTDG